MKLNRQLPLVDATRFSMVPRSDVPRSTFQTQHTVKSTFDCDYLVPLYLDEVLPGDQHSGEVTFFCRLATPLFPIMDNICVETFFFFVPNRLVWANWVRFMGEQPNPGDSIDFVVPQLASANGGFPVGSIYDFFGLPCVGQVLAGSSVSINALPLRAYNLIFNTWFRDQNLQNSLTVPQTDGPDTVGTYTLQKRNKRHDYFTSCLPWPLKGGVDVKLPLGTSAPIKSDGNAVRWQEKGGGAGTGVGNFSRVAGAGLQNIQMSPLSGSFTGGIGLGIVDGFSGMVADLANATAATINSLRLAVTTQQLLERDARGGTRYTELLVSHFGVMSEDFRLQRPEYIGGGKSYVRTQAIPQTSTDAGTATTPLGTLGATIIGSDGHPFRYTAKEHGFIIGLVNVSGDITYQQGLQKMWSRSTRYDYYWPAFANLGEQSVKVKEIYQDGAAGSEAIFGYQERWAEYRHRPSKITGLFKSTSAGNIDEWHLAEQFLTAPALNATFMKQATPFERVAAAGATAAGLHVLWDSVFNVRSTRALPTHSVPGLARF